MFWHEGMGFAGWWGAGLWMLLFWALVVAAVVVLVRWATGGRWTDRGASSTAPPHDPSIEAGPSEAQRILDERFARGEIDEDDYRRRREVLRGTLPPDR